MSRVALPAAIELDGRHFPLTVRKIKGSRRLTLRYQPVKKQVLLTLPWRVSMREALSFLESRRGWLLKQLSEHGPEALAPGQVLHIGGVALTLLHAPEKRGVEVQGDMLCVGGDSTFFARRVQDFVKQEARRLMVPLAEEKARELGKSIRRIRFRDTESRWGSCTSAGELSFSWRLVLAPVEVMDYVVCHEVAHLAVLDHSERFWRVVETLCPHHLKARAWLKRHGHTLYSLC